ncbi:glycosyltransferase family 4 protein [Arcicella lustrica]|uniref:Glycosyltransferase family 4 protein n=1 Tax=Arcicella lustrica TaxID=2984196 RepID=A0ABU5SI30_9BACT|nr:glycosyltransferase family 4 protein [Arcicella sp. DC25W]MEA5426938.1 glycosyltransferase family 4 protein [Arcicella sp. DC25W]
MKKTKIIFWMNIPSFHQNDFLNEISIDFELFVVFAHKINAERVQQGWDFSKNSMNFSYCYLSEKSIFQIFQFIYQHKNALHIFGGIWAEKYFFMALLLLKWLKANYLIYSEAPIPNKKRSVLKRFFLQNGFKFIARKLLQDAKGCLAVGKSGEDFFKKLGVDENRILPFGYFRNLSLGQKQKIHKNTIELIFVGQMIERKGIALLIDAIFALKQDFKNFSLTIIGSGRLETIILEKITYYQLQNHVKLLGTIPADEVPKFIQQADLLILPSDFDGWGMVVNEAILCRTPVLVSDACGAASLIKNNQNGFIFQAGNLYSLLSQLQHFMNLSEKAKTEIVEKLSETAEKISTKSISSYFGQCIDFCLNPHLQKPKPTWL